jgi:hypothetical protein
MMQLGCTAAILFFASLTRQTVGYTPLKGVYVSSVSGQSVDLGDFLSKGEGRSLLVLGTYAADFNAIEYAQRLRYYLPKLKECGVTKCGLVLNCRQDAAKALAEAVDLDTGDEGVTLMVDPDGQAGRAFDVGRGWLPDQDMSPFLKLFGMLFGLGAWAT